MLCSAAISNFISNWLNGEGSVILSPVPYLLLPILTSTALLQMQQLNEAQKYHDSSTVVPVYYICFTLCSIIGSGIVYQDFLKFELDTALGFALGVCACFSGVYLITKRGTVADTYEIKERARAHLAAGPTVPEEGPVCRFSPDEASRLESGPRFEWTNPESLGDPAEVPTRLSLFISTQLDREIITGRQDNNRRSEQTKGDEFLDASTVKHFVPFGAVNQAIHDSRRARNQHRANMHRRTISEPVPRSMFFPAKAVPREGETALL